MAKATSLYICQNCGERYPKWEGQCRSCGEWNTLVESLAEVKKIGSKNYKSVDAASLQKFSQVEPTSAQKSRFSTTIGELDRVLGGGLVPGMMVLIGGEPGIGKSTLLTQMVINLLMQSKGKPETKNQKPGKLKILYCAGEESPQQIAIRISRIMGDKDAQLIKKSDQLVFCTSVDVDEVVSAVHHEKPDLVIVDSIQTLETEELSGAAGSAGQVRETADRLTQAAKRWNVPTFLVGHVTKEGTIAGPKILEHIVDTVLELTGERSGDLRLLRAIKNRFGATDEIGIFRVKDVGLEEVTNPSELLLEEADQSVAGSVVACVMEGTRPLLMEVQALVLESQLAMPRRVGRGVELSRIQVLAAVLQKHCRLPLGNSDIFLSMAGGLSIREPAIDLAAAVAMASSLQNKALPPKTVFIGELGLLGEIRSVNFLDRRIKEARRMGYTSIISRQTHRWTRDVLKQFGLNK